MELSEIRNYAETVNAAFEHCPFCGCLPEIVAERGFEGLSLIVYARCKLDSCGARSAPFTARLTGYNKSAIDEIAQACADVVEVWNRRYDAGEPVL